MGNYSNMSEFGQIQIVLDKLNDLGWNSHDIYYYKQEVELNSGKKADIVLHRAGKAIGLIEVKRVGTILLSHTQQPFLLADELDLKLIYITDGNLIYQLFKDSNIAIQCHQFPSVSELEIVQINTK